MHVYTQNGEEDTVLRDDLKRVKQKLSLTFAIAIIGTCVVFGLLYYLGIDLLSYYIEAGSCMIYYNEKPYIDEFQQYVSDNDISTTDVEQYDEWMSEHDVAFYSVQEMGKVIYNKSNVDKLISPAKICMITDLQEAMSCLSSSPILRRKYLYIQDLRKNIILLL